MIREAETYEVGSTVERDGQTLNVVADLGDSVEFERSIATPIFPPMTNTASKIAAQAIADFN
jgi:hypothetical protein